MTMFKIVNALAALVIKAYDREAARLHNVVVKVDATRTELLEEIDEISQVLEADIRKLRAKAHGKQAELGQVLEQHDAEIDNHVANAQAASAKAQQIKEVLR